jgi:hypothetical protein
VDLVDVYIKDLNELKTLPITEKGDLRFYNELLEMLTEFKKYKIVIKYFQENGDQPTKDIIRKLMSS